MSDGAIGSIKGVQLSRTLFLFLSSYLKYAEDNRRNDNLCRYEFFIKLFFLSPSSSRYGTQ